MNSKTIIVILFASIAFVSCKKSDSDNTAPVITLNGDNTVFIQKGNIYTDAGATATDDMDGSVGVTTSGLGDLNTDSVGVYKISYYTKDKSGNSSFVLRTVVVVNINGEFSVADTKPFIGGIVSVYQDTASLSTTSNGKVSVLKFGNYVNSSVYFYLTSATTISVPSQTVTCGSPATARTFSGSGTLQTISGITVITIDYTEVTGATSIVARGVYTKI